MRKIFEKDLRKSGVKVKPADLSRIASSKSRAAVTNTVKNSAKFIEQLSLAMAKAMDQNSEILKSITSKKLRVRITDRDKDGLISEFIIELV